MDKQVKKEVLKKAIGKSKEDLSPIFDKTKELISNTKPKTIKLKIKF